MSNLADGNNGAIVSAVINMGRSLRQRVSAEGAEGEHQLDFLRNLHCDAGQGYWFSRPVPAGPMEAMLRVGVCR